MRSKLRIAFGRTPRFIAGRILLETGTPALFQRQAIADAGYGEQVFRPRRLDFQFAA